MALVVQRQEDHRLVAFQPLSDEPSRQLRIGRLLVELAIEIELGSDEVDIGECALGGSAWRPASKSREPNVPQQYGAVYDRPTGSHRQSLGRASASAISWEKRRPAARVARLSAA
mgnify:CR=1 FL=1